MNASKLNRTREEIASSRTKIFLITINALLLVGLVLDVTLRLIFDYQEEDTYITLCDYSKKESEEIYDSLITKDNDNYVVENVYDYGVYGTYLDLSSSKIYPGAFNSYSSLYLKRIANKNSVNVAYSSQDQVSLNASFVNGGIDLASLDVGDYIIFDEIILESNYSSTHTPLKIVSSTPIEEVYYTPLIDNTYHKKITLVNNEDSPCLVIKVEKTTDIEKDYYDYVIVGSDTSNFVQNLNGEDKYIVVDNLLDAYKYHAPYAYILSDEEGIISSYYLDDDCLKDSLSSTSHLEVYDDNDYIRELGGYLFNAGSATKGEDASFIVSGIKGNHDPGKITYIVNQNSVKK